MLKNKEISKLICLIVSFTLFFSLFNVSYATEEIDAEKFGEEQPKIVKALTELLVSLGDGIIHIISVGVGENITIDKLIYNNVQKVSIDYFDDIASDDAKDAKQEPIKAFMEPVVEKWYAVFFKISTMVYMIVLVYIGVTILISSTAEKRASYKQLFSTWCMGIAILFIFPYVMKYIILVNNAFVKSLQGYGGYEEYVGSNNLATKDYYEIYSKYGTNDFVDELIGLPEGEKRLPDDECSMMVLTRRAAQVDEEQSKEGDIGLAIIYLILIGQMIAILIMYYKRAFMIAFLITIFPLVAMTYVIDKLRRWKKSVFWYLV